MWQDVAQIELVDDAGRVLESHPRNKWGSFFSVYQPNKWQLKRAALAASTGERETVMT
jgi:hypothetical protein